MRATVEAEVNSECDRVEARYDLALLARQPVEFEPIMGEDDDADDA